MTMKKTLLLLCLCLFAGINAHALIAEVDGIYYNIANTEATVISGTNRYIGHIVLPESFTHNGSTYNVTAIGEQAFYQCGGLASIVIPNSVKTIGKEAFYFCSNLPSVTIPSSVTTIGENAFAYCFNLKDLTLCEGLKSIGKSAFIYCNQLTSVTIPGSVTKLDNGNEFQSCSSLTTVTFSEGVSQISGYTFTDCSALSTVHLPSTLTYIGYRTFQNCTSLKTVYSLSTSAPSDGGYDQAFAGSSCNTATLYVPSSALDSYRNANSWKNFGTIVAMNQLVTIDDIEYKLDLTTTTASVVSKYPYYAGSITIPPSINSYGLTFRVTSIGNSAFMFSNDLTSVTIPEGVEIIYDYAFHSCAGITSITIPNSVTDIRQQAFYKCAITSVTIPGGLTNFGPLVFASCTRLKEVTIMDGVSKIGNYAFDGCTSLTFVSIPNSVTTIGVASFNGCSSLGSITIPSSVTIIDSNAFKGCTSLNTILCYAEEPPTVNPNSFTNVNVSEVTLYVPDESVELYKAHDVWKQFFVDTITGINEVDNCEIVKSSNGQIYNLSGQRLSKPQNGINIVGGKKVMVK